MNITQLLTQKSFPGHIHRFEKRAEQIITTNYHTKALEIVKTKNVRIHDRIGRERWAGLQGHWWKLDHFLAGIRTDGLTDTD